MEYRFHEAATPDSTTRGKNGKIEDTKFVLCFIPHTSISLILLLTVDVIYLALPHSYQQSELNKS
jgi:hypothetical protein